MDRRCIVLFLALVVLLQPAFASVCMMDCPPQVAAQPAQPMVEHVAHAHHHAMAAARSDSYILAATDMCDQNVDLRSNASIPPTVAPALMTTNIVVLEAASQAGSSHSRVIDRIDRFNAPIVIPLRI